MAFAEKHKGKIVLAVIAIDVLILLVLIYLPFGGP